MSEVTQESNQLFAEVIDALVAGGVARRHCWKGGIYVFRQVPAMVPADVIPKMTSVPLLVKALLDENPNEPLIYRNQLASLNLVDREIHGWSPSAADVLATDWIVQRLVSHAPNEPTADEPMVARETVGTARPLAADEKTVPQG